MELRRLDQALQPIGVPRGKLLHQEDPTEQGQVLAHGHAADAERRGDLAHIDEARRVPTYDLGEPIAGDAGAAFIRGSNSVFSPNSPPPPA